MHTFLLTGAGFSRNWGGWLVTEAFEYLLGCQSIINNKPLRDLLWSHQATGGFEGALDELQRKAKSAPIKEYNQLGILQKSVLDMFDDMNSAFSRIDFEFQSPNDRVLSAQNNISSFLARFDAIFTLNQDLLMEQKYLINDSAFIRMHKWNGAQLPGLRISRKSPAPVSNQFSDSIWTPIQEPDFAIDQRTQPFFKLHGSSNWRDSSSHELLVIGGNKADQISDHPILNWYSEKFREFVGKSGSKLIIIGYGFRDSHINKIISDSVMNNGLKLFIVDPLGAEIATRQNDLVGMAGHHFTPLEDVFREGLAGGSRRPLKEIFGSDSLELRKIERFLKSE